MCPNSISPTLRQSPGQVRDKVMKVRDTNHVADFHDLCPRQVRDFVANLSRTLSQTSRHVKMVCVHDFPRGEVSVKVGVMEFRLKLSLTAAL